MAPSFVVRREVRARDSIAGGPTPASGWGGPRARAGSGRAESDHRELAVGLLLVAGEVRRLRRDPLPALLPLRAVQRLGRDLQLAAVDLDPHPVGVLGQV